MSLFRPRLVRDLVSLVGGQVEGTRGMSPSRVGTVGGRCQSKRKKSQRTCGGRVNLRVQKRSLHNVTGSPEGLPRDQS